MESKDLLVGSTGFVGGNLLKSHEFYSRCHSSDIKDYFGSSPELCVYAGVPASMVLANSNPDADMDVIREARENIRGIQPKKLVLISSIAVYKDSRGYDEDSTIIDEGLSAYGRNRLKLEKWIREDFDDVLIIRLPALFGVGLKKNFLYDLHTITPQMLKADKYQELAIKNKAVAEGYTLKDNGFYVLNNKADNHVLRDFFQSNDYNALYFTDSRSRYQFYNLLRLWKDIMIGLDHDLNLLNLSTPPVTAIEVYETITGKDDWKNELEAIPFDYDMRTKYAELYGGTDGYLCTQEEEIQEIKEFMESWKE